MTHIRPSFETILDFFSSMHSWHSSQTPYTVHHPVQHCFGQSSSAATPSPDVTELENKKRSATTVNLWASQELAEVSVWGREASIMGAFYPFYGPVCSGLPFSFPANITNTGDWLAWPSEHIQKGLHHSLLHQCAGRKTWALSAALQGLVCQWGFHA